MVGEYTSAEVASIAARGLSKPESLTYDQIQAVCASALTQVRGTPMVDETLKAQDDAAAAVAVAPRVTLDDIEAAIVGEVYLNAGEAAVALGLGATPSMELLTLCILTLSNGFTVTGESACASPENYNEALGREIAKRHAIEKCWPLFGFALRDKLANPEPG